MKKSIILFCLTLFLSSCFKSDEELLGINSNSTSQNNIITDIRTDTHTGSIGQIENDESIEKQNVEIEEIQNNKKLIMKDYNVFLRQEEENDIIYKYKILATSGNFGVVKRMKEICGLAIRYHYYTINLDNKINPDSEMIKIPIGIESNKDRDGQGYVSLFGGDIDIKEIVNNNQIIFIINNDIVVDNEEDLYRGLVLHSTLLKEGFYLNGNNWEKKIDLNEVAPDIEEN